MSDRSIPKQLCVIPSCSNDRLEDSDYCYWHAQEFPEPPSARLEALPSNERFELLSNAIRLLRSFGEAYSREANEIERLQGLQVETQEDGPIPTDGQLLDQLEDAFYKADSGYVCQDIALRRQLAELLVRYNNELKFTPRPRWRRLQPIADVASKKSAQETSERCPYKPTGTIKCALWPNCKCGAEKASLYPSYCKFCGGVTPCGCPAGSVVKASDERVCQCATYCMANAGMKCDPPVKCRALTGPDPGAHVRFK